MGKSVSAPQQNLGNEYNQTLTAQGQAYGQLLGLENQYAPQQTALSGQLQNQGFGQAANTVGQYSPLLQSIFNQGQQQAIAGNPLYNQMYQSAQQGLSQGGQLSPYQQEYATQAGLQGFAQRGMGNSNMAILQSALSNTNLSQARYQQNLQNASSVYGQMPGATGYSSLVGGALQGGLGAANTLSNFSLNPESSYAGNVYDSNQSAQLATNSANANMQNSMMGAGIGLLGSVITGGATAGLFSGGLGAGASAGLSSGVGDTSWMYSDPLAGLGSSNLWGGSGAFGQ